MPVTKDEKYQYFEIRRNHIRLLKEVYIDWCNTEFGAPSIDPKRPFGNSYVYGDIGRILGIKGDIDDGYSNGGYSDEQEREMGEIYRDLQFVLQIAIATGSFKIGKYRAKLYTTGWKEIR
jgi:hypothetical protein